jgi:hypothetical protein
MLFQGLFGEFEGNIGFGGLCFDAPPAPSNLLLLDVCAGGVVLQLSNVQSCYTLASISLHTSNHQALGSDLRCNLYHVCHVLRRSPSFTLARCVRRMLPLPLP